MRCRLCGKDLGNGHRPNGRVLVHIAGLSEDSNFYLCNECWYMKKRYMNEHKVED